MFVGRTKELAQLNQMYQLPENAAAVVYGREGIGKTTLVKEFIRDKSFVYYQAREFSEEEQKRYFDQKMEEFRQKSSVEKTCFVIDEFDLMQKGYKDFFADFAAYFQTITEGNGTFILVSSSIQWVENSMVEEIGPLASAVTATIKVKEFTFMEMVDRFPDSSTETCITIYSILGGVPAYLDMWNPKESVKKNVIRLIVDPRGSLHREAQRFLKTSLRELPFYSTILAVLAEDDPKLNYLYSRTHFSRAKISVYIRNLIQLDVAEKILSFEPEKKNSAKKGLYGLRDAYLEFWYRLIYPNLSELSMLEPEEFYSRCVKKGLAGVQKKAYIRVCTEFMELMSRYHKLPVQFERFAPFYGKDGYLPVVGSGTNGELLVGSCYWTDKPVGVHEFEDLLRCADQIGREADHYYLFSKAGFTKELSQMAENMDNIQCIGLDQM